MAKHKVFKKEVYVKFVKKANMWCRTHWNDRGEQIQEWFTSDQKPGATITVDN